MTKPIFIAVILAGSAGVASAGIVGDALAGQVSLIASAVVTFVVGYVWGAVNRRVSARAAAALAKSEADRTLADRAAILAEQQLRNAEQQMRADKIEQLTRFTVDYALANIDKLTPALAPLQQADDMVTGYLEAFERRNPDLAAYMKLDRQSATERLAAAITSALTHVGTPPAPGAVSGQV